jgi:hypothetical protein
VRYRKSSVSYRLIAQIPQALIVLRDKAMLGDWTFDVFFPPLNHQPAPGLEQEGNGCSFGWLHEVLVSKRAARSDLFDIRDKNGQIALLARCLNSGTFDVEDGGDNGWVDLLQRSIAMVQQSHALTPVEMLIQFTYSQLVLKPSFPQLAEIVRPVFTHPAVSKVARCFSVVFVLSVFRIIVD